jgi:uncharacterized protein (TIGR03067 family)
MVFLVIVCRPAAAALNAADDAADELKKLEGEWQAVETEAEGQKWDKDSKGVRDKLFIIKGNELRIPHPSGNGKDRRKTITLNPEITPKQMDMLSHDGVEAGQTTAAIYQLEGDRLTICMPYFGNDPRTRPSEFKTTLADGRMLIVLERKQP